jgi:VRR-NUC domain
MGEAELYPAIIGALSNGPTRLLRINAGFAWQGTVAERTPRRLVLLDPRPVKLGVPGVSDLIGWTTVDLPGELSVAVFTAIEVKFGRGRLTPEQSAFLHTVNRMGGRAGVARSVEDARGIIEGDNADPS